MGRGSRPRIRERTGAVAASVGWKKRGEEDGFF